MTSDGFRDEIIGEARRWLGTPYQHNASCIGAGADCLGLVLGICRRVFGEIPEDPPPYTPDWGEIPDEAGEFPEILLDAARRHFQEIPTEAIQPGDLLLFRMNDLAPVKHAGILTSEDRMIHAYSGRGVRESFLGRWWKRRLAAAFILSPKEI